MLITTYESDIIKKALSHTCISGFEENSSIPILFTTEIDVNNYKRIEANTVGYIDPIHLDLSSVNKNGDIIFCINFTAPYCGSTYSAACAAIKCIIPKNTVDVYIIDKNGARIAFDSTITRITDLSVLNKLTALENANRTFAAERRKYNRILDVSFITALILMCVSCFAGIVLVALHQYIISIPVFVIAALCILYMLLQPVKDFEITKKAACLYTICEERYKTVIATEKTLSFISNEE